MNEHSLVSVFLIRLMDFPDVRWGLSIVSVKTLVDGGNTYVRAMIKNSFGNEPRPAVI